MKHFKLIGPLTTTEFDIEDDQMLTWQIINTKDYEKGKSNPLEWPEKNRVAYPTEKQS